MSRDLKLFVVDTGPLNTLAAAQSIDYLQYADAARLGAQDIIDWVKSHHAQIRINLTRACERYDFGRPAAPEFRERTSEESAQFDAIEKDLAPRGP